MNDKADRDDSHHVTEIGPTVARRQRRMWHVLPQAGVNFAGKAGTAIGKAGRIDEYLEAAGDHERDQREIESAHT